MTRGLLFPHHFNICHPFPSFNVKDLDTVDNGCIEHLFPYLYNEDWDVLMAHFLGVDHAGHIFSVDSTEMIEKLDQYNGVLEKVVDVLESQSGPGGLHENTLLLVMGDHGQTINGNHGGGAPEEVETSLFAMSLQKHPSSSLPTETDSSSCRLDMERRKICTSSIEQLDFAATVSALLGIPYPFRSIGRVNPELYALAAGTWNLDNFTPESGINLSRLERWMQNYVNVLCMNTWQFFSHSFILEEGKTASFLLATAGMLQSRHAIVKKTMLLEGLLFVLVVPFLRFGIELGQSKQAVNSLFLKSFPSWTVGIEKSTNLWIYVADILPFLALIILAYRLYKSIRHSSCRGIFKFVVVGTIFASSLIALAWALDVSLLCGKEKTSGWEEDTILKATAMLSAWSSTIIILSGKQGPLVALAAVIQGWCIIRLMTLERDGLIEVIILSEAKTLDGFLLSIQVLVDRVT
ncbi:hypothetical protein RND71_020771 [Anisodus tanguticus]|uniref:GPI ethanolamine phosphate transferase 3 n=1 Tax=Anisodus tanguticus TaxID=243964 RepID=A0AAE1RW48_9SOLA|nr:hypothetical protein RND71_020771 [Anisodus tanguticus]